MKIVEVELSSLDLRYVRLRSRRPNVERRLLASLGETGQQSPVIVVPGEQSGSFVLIEGRKRVRALRRMGADAVRAAVWELPAPEALLTAYQMANGSGWNALEEGWLVYELVRGAGLSATEVGRRLERSKAWVSGRLGLVESLPERVLAGVQCGKIGAYAATKYLLPFARANAADCEKLAEKIIEFGFRSREVETLCRYYSTAGRKAAKQMLAAPERFLMAVEEARKGKQDAALSEVENRCVKNMALMGNVALSLARNLPEIWGVEAESAARRKLEGSWTRCRERWNLLERTASGLLAAAGINVEGGDAG